MEQVIQPVTLHKRGWTTAGFDASGNSIVSAGYDGKVKISASLTDSSPLEHVVGEKINAIACRSDTIVLATEGTFVNMIELEDGLPNGLATRFTAEVNDIAINKERSKIAVCSNDFTIKLVDFTTTNDQERECQLTGHQGPVLSVAFDPLDVYLASASCDGTVRIWNCSDQCEVKRLNSVASITSDRDLAPSRCRLCWDSIMGEFLCVPVDKEIFLYERGSWQSLTCLTSPSLRTPIVCCSCSNDGSMLAAGSSDGRLVVWRLSDRQIIHRAFDPSEALICSVAWHPNQRFNLIMATTNGQLASITVPKPEVGDNDALSPSAIADLLDFDVDDGGDNHFANAAQAESSRIEDDKLLPIDKDAGSDDDDANGFDLGRIKSSFAVDKAEEEEGAKPTTAGDQQPPAAPVVVTTKINPHKPFQSGSMPIGFRERFMVWNRIGIVTQYRGTDESEDSDNDDEDEEIKARRRNQRQSDCIEVDFHDSTQHHSLRLSNAVGYSMADLSSSAVMLATRGSDDPTLADDFDAGERLDPSDVGRISILPLSDHNSAGSTTASDASSDVWSITLPAGEACDAICLVSGGLAVAATSRSLLRVFAQPLVNASLIRTSSSSSMHLIQVNSLGLAPVSLPGSNVVTMASHPSLPLLAVVVNTSSSALAWRLFSLGARAASPLASSWTDLPLSPDDNNRLTWFGFSDLGNLFSHDSQGIVRRLVSRPLHYWTPVANSRSTIAVHNRRSDNFFIVGINESAAALETDELGHCIEALHCKASKWPRVFPRPLLARLNFQLPLCEMASDQGKLEETYLRLVVSQDLPEWAKDSDPSVRDSLQAIVEQCSNKCKGVLLRLFALAAKLDSDWASLAIARLMPDSATVQLAIRYAGRLRRQHLAQRLSTIALDKERPVTGSDTDSSDQGSSEDGSRQSADEDDDVVYERRRQSHQAGHSRRKQSASSSSDTDDNQSPPPSRSRHASSAHDASSLVSTDDDLSSSANRWPESSSGMLGGSQCDTQGSSSSVVRNPFKNMNRQESSTTPAALRGRGSEVFDSWKPTPKSSSSTAGKPSGKKMTKTKKVSASSTQKPKGAPRGRPPKKVEQKVAESQPSDFFDWFDQNRTLLDDKYPELSADELTKVAMKDFRLMKSKLDRFKGLEPDRDGQQPSPADDFEDEEEEKENADDELVIDRRKRRHSGQDNCVDLDEQPSTNKRPSLFQSCDDA